MSGKAKKIISVVLILITVSAVTGYFLWNKPHLDIASATGKQTEAAALYKAFTTDSAAAKKDYLLQVVEVSGTVNAISKNQQDQTVVTIKTAADGAYINCTMEGLAENLSAGSGAKIKGMCQGIGQADADLGIMGDVYLVRCYEVK